MHNGARFSRDLIPARQHLPYNYNAGGNHGCTTNDRLHRGMPPLCAPRLAGSVHDGRPKRKSGISRTKQQPPCGIGTHPKR